MKIFQTLMFKITVGIVFVTSVTLVSISLFAFTSAQNQFQESSTRLVAPNGDIIFVRSTPPVTLENIRKDFGEKLENSIVTGGIVGISIALVLGLFFSIIITKPIEKLKEGIAHLRNSHYKYKIESTGEKELDDVIDEFNTLTTELSAQEELRKDLISDVSHELKTPLTSILGQVQGIRDGVFKPDDNRLEVIQKEAERLSSLVNLLQEYTKLRSKTLNIEKKDINLNELVEDIAKSHEKVLEEKKMKVINNVSKELKVHADELMLERIIQNLIDNAIKYSKAKEVTVSIEDKKIIISDNGVGIPEESIGKVFERFYRVEKSRNRETGGLGLGLALVKEMVEVHGWQIKAINNEKGGVRFEIETK
ncbi:MAG: HAMP domain-containing sensor histidine kinase [Candidatus Dojkabacteria bacterium]